MKIAVVTIGDELLSGDVVDTNTADIGRALRSAGYQLDQAVTLSDQPQQIAEMLFHLNQQRMVTLVCGGLGPTRDDVTARAAAQAFHLSLVLNDNALQQIHAFFERAGQPFAAGNEKQALIPHKAQLMENRCGTAPGFIIHHNNCPLFFMPGVPEEMREMLYQHVLPALRCLFPPPCPCAERLLKVFGLPESEIERLLPAELFAEAVSVAFRLEFPLVLVKLNSRAADETLLDHAEAVVRHQLGAHVVASGTQTLPAVTAESLLRTQKTIALAESCTGGLIAKLLTDQPGSSAFLERGVVSYANTAKHDWLGVPNALLHSKGAVSRECAESMASGIRQRARTDLGLAVTGIAGPGGGSPEKPCGTVYIALADAQHCQVREHHFGGDRHQVRMKTAYSALDWLRRYLDGL